MVRRLGSILLISAILAGAVTLGWQVLAGKMPRDRAAGLARARAELSVDLAGLGLRLGAPVYMRIFKATRELEVWLYRASDRTWVHFRTYDICNYSGRLGPKLREGDRQSPEGLYRIRSRQLHPTSRFHLAFNLGFPNAYDRAQGRTGSYLMVHGDCVSIGCYAMTDAGIEEIYALGEAALVNGQNAFQVHAFPARLTESWLNARTGSRWHGFWTDLRTCYDLFEADRRPPSVHVESRRYRCSASKPSGPELVF